MVLYVIFFRVTSLSVSINDEHRYLSVIQHYARIPPYKTEKEKCRPVNTLRSCWKIG